MSTSTNGTTNGTRHSADEAIDGLYSFSPGTTPPAPPLPEAAFSLTLKGRLGGQEAMLTARGMSAEEFKRNVETIKGLLDPLPTPPAPTPTQGRGEGWCLVHNCAMQENVKDGRRWWSHKTTDGWCKGHRR